MINLKQIAQELRTTPTNAQRHFIEKYELTPVTTNPDRYDPKVVRPLIKRAREQHRANVKRGGNVKAQGLSRSHLPKKFDFQQILEKAAEHQAHPLSHQLVISAPRHLINVGAQQIKNYNRLITPHIDDISKKISRRFMKKLRRQLGYEGEAAKVVPKNWYGHIVVAEKVDSKGHETPWHFHIAFFLSKKEQEFFKAQQTLIKSFMKDATKAAFMDKYNCDFTPSVSLSAANQGILSYFSKGLSEDEFHIHVSGSA